MKYIEGILKIANLFLALVAGTIAINLFKILSRKKGKKEIIVWKLLAVALIFFAMQMVFGALRAFRIFESPYITHIIPTVILTLIIIAIVFQINIHKN